MALGRNALVLREASRLLGAGVSGHVFPGGAACVAYRHRGSWVYTTAVAGALGVQAGRALGAVREHTPYDLASITKSFVAVAALRMCDEGALQLDAVATDVLLDLRTQGAPAVTLEQLLSHRSGLAAWGGLYLDVAHEPGTTAARRWILSEASRRLSESNEVMLYSDLGYMLAGEMVARADGANDGRALARTVRRRVTEPLDIHKRVRFAGALEAEERAELARTVAPTERCAWRGRMVRGEVHDENCAALGGVSGHAGLFGTAEGVAHFGTALLDSKAGRSDFLAQPTLEHALAERPGGSYRLGFDVKSGDAPAAGRRASSSTFGHLGFTGTSFWCDPERDVVVVLLTNRVHPSRANEKIRAFRPAFHDGVLAALD